MTSLQYVRDPAEIYRQSFATVEAEADLLRFKGPVRNVATRLIHSCGMIDIVDDLAVTAGAIENGQCALDEGCSIFCDVEMVRSGIIPRLLSADNDIICTLNDERVPAQAAAIGNTRSAAAVDLWGDDLEGAVVVIGNAPTALFRLLERIEEGAPKPSLVVGVPVGFVGAVESKQALASRSSQIESIVVHGRRGGSAMACAIVNAIAGGLQ